jgi:hypothetical protein
MELPNTLLKGMNQSELLSLYRLIKCFPTSNEVLKNTNSKRFDGKEYLEQSVFISTFNTTVKLRLITMFKRKQFQPLKNIFCLVI